LSDFYIRVDDALASGNVSRVNESPVAPVRIVKPKKKATAEKAPAKKTAAKKTVSKKTTAKKKE
jgi:hypothetical protein